MHSGQGAASPPRGVAGVQNAGEPPGWELELGRRHNIVGPASPMPLSDALQLLVDGAEAGPLAGLVGPALLHESEHSVGAQLGAGQAAPCEDEHSTPGVRRGV